MTQNIDRLLTIMKRLRDPERGCEWDTAQSFETIAPYTIEEAYEVADAIERKDYEDLKGELGDLLFQVVFHAQMASEDDHFDFGAVVETISDKMERRHPHIFGNEGGVMEETRWEDLKAAERSEAGSDSAMDGVAKALPALMRSQKLQKRAARHGFDWPDAEGPRAKVLEEIEELSDASPEEREEEAGDLLFAAVNLVRAYGIDAEQALRAANAKFERRFRSMEDLAGGDFDTRSLEAQEELWQAVKRAEKS
ncbi:nucleoside triphosphate pyrophosphohydrolase [Qipengyuania nanhaisediminis]|uniref:ATP diphosphatase n=1 Tax=Qipengyuania nanhaisediminis TaxID=604088 RepID=A0A1I5MKD8_9SPHN|nr:nucleoside triphosphate pyrophosphohydrolase [Qipengyuania nanhaisediminis]SFP09396.1 ATP diphosphatase [Qipengyuania nanhaisediminis]